MLTKPYFKDNCAYYLDNTFGAIELFVAPYLKHEIDFSNQRIMPYSQEVDLILIMINSMEGS